MSGYDDSYARQNSPEGRAAIEQARAEVKAAQDEALLEELSRHQDALLPGAVAEIARLHGRTLGASSDPARVAGEVAKWMAGERAKRFLKPAEDTLGKVLDRYRDKFRDAAAMARFKDAVSLEVARKPEAEIVSDIVGRLGQRSANQYLKSPIGPSERVRHVASLMKPWSHQIATDEIELAESWGDLVDPLQARRSDVDLERTIVVRLGLPHNAKHIRDGAFDPEDRRGDRVGVRRAAVQEQPADAGQAPTRKPLFSL